MILWRLFNTVSKARYKYVLVDSCIINYANINQRRQISYHSIISCILGYKTWTINFSFYYFKYII